MTLIIGFRASNGVVLGADRKTLRGFEVEYRRKIYLYQNRIALAAVGLTGVVDDFYDLLQSEIERRRGINTLYEFKIIAEDILAELTRRYADRVHEPSPANVVVAGLEYVNMGKAKMYYVHGEGYGEFSRFICIGHGGPYALSLAKFLLDERKSVEENARRVAYIIAWVSEDVDTTVGGIPDVLIIRDREKESQQIIKWLSEDEVRKIMEKVRKDKKNLSKLLGFEKT